MSDNKITAKDVLNKITNFEKNSSLSDPFDIGVDDFIKDAGTLSQEQVSSIKVSVNKAVEAFEKDSAIVEKQVETFIDTVEDNIKKANLTDDQAAKLWFTILQRMN